MHVYHTVDAVYRLLQRQPAVGDVGDADDDAGFSRIAG